jgi:hypothetical protein
MKSGESSVLTRGWLNWDNTVTVDGGRTEGDDAMATAHMEAQRKRFALYYPETPAQESKVAQAIEAIAAASARARTEWKRGITKGQAFSDCVVPVLIRYRSTGAHDTASREAIWDATFTR